jgi:putative cardiolipin synthase
MGLIVDSPVLARALSGAFDDVIPKGSYRASLAANGRLEWIEPLPDGAERRHDREPGTTLTRRLAVGFLALLPIEGLL